MNTDTKQNKPANTKPQWRTVGIRVNPCPSVVKMNAQPQPRRKAIEKADVCPSCGVPWVKHPGTIQTCAEIKRLRAVIDRARAVFSEHGPSVIAAVKMETALNA